MDKRESRGVLDARQSECFCNSTQHPKPPHLATPHFCGNLCSRSRETGCGQASLPSPCPPYQVTLQIPSPCPKHQVVVFRCGDDSLSAKGKSQEDPASREKAVSCGSVCGRLLDCRKHSRQRICHTGACARRGYIDRWIGRFRCELICDR